MSPAPRQRHVRSPQPYHPAFSARNVEAADIEALKPHEAVKEKASHQYRAFAGRIGTKLRVQPIIIDRQTNVILDGHHRWLLFQEMGCRTVPVIRVDYLTDDRIRVEARRQGETVTKHAVIHMGLSGTVFPPKTTKHVFFPDRRKVWVSLQKYCGM